MAITIKQSPESFSPVYNEINYVVSSDKIAQDNFQYICDLYITGVSSPAYVRLKATQDPSTGFAVFDVHRVLENYVNSDIDKSTYGFQKNTSSYVKYQCKFGEEFGLSTSGTTVYADLTLSTAAYAYNGLFDFLEFQDYDDADWLINNTSSFFLTSLKSKKVRDDMYSWVHMMVDTAGRADRMVIDVTDTSGNVTQKSVSNAFQALADDDSRFIRFSAGPANINLISSGDIILGSQPLIPTNAASYQIYTTTGGGVRTSEKLTFTLDDTCTNHDIYVFHFLNQYGGFDSFAFIRVSRHKTEINRSKFKKPLGTLTAVTGAYSYNKKDRSDVQYDTNLKDRIEVYSDWLTDAESTWLEELVSSPEIYVDDATHGLVAVNIIDTVYERRKAVNDKAFNLRITFEYSYNRYRQRF